MARLTFDKLLILAANLLSVYALLAFQGFRLTATFWQAAPVLGIVLAATIALVFFERPWVFLVAGAFGILTPMLVLFVFASPSVVLQAQAGIEYSGALAHPLAIVLALTGGIGGFVRARRGERWTIPQGFGTSTGVGVVLLVVLYLGMGLSSVLAHENATSAGPSAAVDASHATIQLTTKDIQFAPATLNVPAGKLVEIAIDNQDSVDHTFTYAQDGVTFSHPLPSGSKTSVFVQFAAPGDVPFWCIPHSPGMKGTIHVV